MMRRRPPTTPPAPPPNALDTNGDGGRTGPGWSRGRYSHIRQNEPRPTLQNVLASRAADRQQDGGHTTTGSPAGTPTRGPATGSAGPGDGARAAIGWNAAGRASDRAGARHVGTPASRGAIIADRESFDSALWAAAEARANVLDSITSEEILEIVAAAADVWLKPHYGPRVELLETMSETLGLTRAMLVKGFDSIFSVLDKRSIAEMIVAEAPVPNALDDFVRRPDGSISRLAGPPLVLHALAGNVPGLSVPPMVACMLARSISVIRDSVAHRPLTLAFLATIRELSPDLASTVIPVTWPAGAGSELERYVFEQASRVEVSGSDATLRAIAALHRAPAVGGGADGNKRRHVERGTRLSVAVVPREADPHRWRDAFAEDVAMYDGLGCLTPHLILVEGDLERGRRVARTVGIGLARLEKLWPRRPRGLESERTRRAFVGGAEVSVTCDPERLLLRGQGDAWIVHVSPEAHIGPGPGLRCVTVVPVRDRADTIAALREAEAPLAGVALALEPDAMSYPAWVNAIRRCGATLVCKPGELQRPPLAWPQDGRKRLGDLLAWRTEDEL